jgi:hypothetical protein
VSGGLEQTESKPGKGKKKMWLRCGGRDGSGLVLKERGAVGLLPAA